MSKLKFTLASFAIVIGIGGAVATHATGSKSVSKDDPTLQWYDANNGYVQPNTVADEIDQSECKGGTIFCQKGYAASQYVDPTNVPASGVKTSEIDNYTELDKNH